MHNKKILIIEDNFLTLNEIEIRVKEMGYKQTETAISGDEALEKIKEFKPDLVLTDINLGDGIDGIDTAVEIKKKHDIPIIYLTAYDDEETLGRAKINDPSAYLVKPLQERELRIALSIAFYKHKTEKKLKNLIATKDKFFNIIAHDLRNPFNSILGYAELLKSNHEKFDKKTISEMTTALYESAHNTYKLVENLLTWSRSQLGKLDFSPTSYPLQTLINDSISSISMQAKKKEIEIENKINSAAEIYIDQNMIGTVLRNLLSNAIKFSQRNSSIVISSRVDEPFIEISVKDYGVGIKEEKIKDLFDIENNITSIGTENEEGTGLGLVLCKEFVKKHRCDIWVESESGKGSTFTFTVPIVP